MRRLKVHWIAVRVLSRCRSESISFRIDPKRVSSIVGIWPRSHIVRWMEDALACRTPDMGYHVERCPHGCCAQVRCHSCRNRSCPLCSEFGIQTSIEKLRAKMLACAYHHAVFTMPRELYTLARFSPDVVYNLMFKVAAQVLQDFALDPQWLGGRPGITIVLHTWNRRGLFHPHLHVLITAGGLSEEGKWVLPVDDGLFPANKVARMWRGKLLTELRNALRKGKLKLPPSSDEHAMDRLIGSMHRRKWNVRIMERYESVDEALAYVVRYAKGSPIKDSRLLAYDGNNVTIDVRSAEDARYEVDLDEGNTITISDVELVRRLAIHVPRKGKHTQRSYGLYAGTHSKTKLLQAREALNMPPQEKPKKVSFDEYLKCPECGARLLKAEEFPSRLIEARTGKLRAPRATGPPDVLRAV